jgi:parallel beta-helix repeat protein
MGTMNAEGTDVSGPIGADTTWDTAGSPWIVVGNVSVNNGVTLTIDPGVVVKFDGFHSIFVDGTLSAVGTESSRILITSNFSSPARSDWDRIQVNSSGHADIGFANISYAKYAVYLQSSINNAVKNCSISDISEGVHLQSLADNNTIENNTIKRSALNGIGIVSSHDSLIKDNLISDSDMFGIQSLLSTGNTYEGNTLLRSNNYGIRLFSSSNNILFHNNLVNNSFGTYQTYDNSDDNEWNAIYPTGGNYWSDYSPTCADSYEGALTPQTSGSPDGICDNKREIDTDSIDYYPLVEPHWTYQVSQSAEIRGKVVDDSHSPLEGALVELVNSIGNVVGQKTTNSTGDFVFIGPPFGNYALHVTRQGYISNNTTAVSLLIFETTVDVGDIMLEMIKGRLTITSPTAGTEIGIGVSFTVEGSATAVIPPYDPIGNIDIEVRLYDPGSSIISESEGTTGADGNFEIELQVPDGILPGIHTICVHTTYGGIADKCVDVNIKGPEFPWGLVILIVVAIIVLVIVMIIFTLYALKKEKPQGQGRVDQYPPPPPAPPPPPGQPPTQATQPTQPTTPTTPPPHPPPPPDRQPPPQQP